MAQRRSVLSCVRFLYLHIYFDAGLAFYERENNRRNSRLRKQKQRGVYTRGRGVRHIIV